MQSLETLRYRLRYSPLPRLVLNGLKRLGVTILPYYLFTRPVTAAPHAPVDRGSACLIELHEQDMATIAALPMATNRESAFRARLRQGQRCFGLRLNGEIVSYCWMATGSCRVNGEDIVMAGDEVYAFDIYTLPAQRGGNLAPLLNALFTEMLRAAGIRRVLSVVDYYNRPSLRFTQKIGARPQRLNLFVNLFGLVEKSFLLKAIIGDAAAGAASPQKPA